MQGLFSEGSWFAVTVRGSSRPPVGCLLGHGRMLVADGAPGPCGQTTGTATFPATRPHGLPVLAHPLKPETFAFSPSSQFLLFLLFSRKSASLGPVLVPSHHPTFLGLPDRPPKHTHTRERGGRSDVRS